MEEAKQKQLAALVEMLPPQLIDAISSSAAEQIDPLLEQLTAEQQAALNELMQIFGDSSASEEEDDDSEGLDETLEEFDPWLQAIAAVAQGDDSQRAEVEAVLAGLEEKGWHLHQPVIHIWAGERDGAVLTAGLDVQDKALIERLLGLVG